MDYLGVKQKRFLPAIIPSVSVVEQCTRSRAITRAITRIAPTIAMPEIERLENTDWPPHVPWARPHQQFVF
jgi:hypothetical protein